MNIKFSVIVLHFFTIMVPIMSETYNDQFYYRTKNESTTTTANNRNFKEFKTYDGLESTSVLYGVVKIASMHRQKLNQCYQELNQVYDGINRKEMWAIKGN